MPKNLIDPIQYIRHQESMQQYSCCLCKQFSVDMVRCRGLCKSPFCLSCVTKTKHIRKECPNNCSQNFSVDIIPEFKLQFYCPFNRLECTKPINNLSQFRHHCQTCNFKSEAFRIECENKQKYLCQNKHQLVFLTQEIAQKLGQNYDYYSITLNQICNLCQQKSHCRSICLECSTILKKVVYCPRCRIPPFSQLFCPIGHFLQKRSDVNDGVVCDLCGISSIIYESQSYEDRVCNIDICPRCYIDLPQTNELIPMPVIVKVQSDHHQHYASDGSGSDSDSD